MTALKLNIGAGPVRIEGYTDIDRLNGDEAYPLTGYEDDSVEEIRASHILEHFGHAEILAVMQEWVRVLKPGGKIYVAVPDFNYIASTYKNGSTEDKSRLMLFTFAMGGQTTKDDFHRSMFDEPMLRELMAALGLRSIHKWTSDEKDCASLPVSLNLCGTKARDVKLPRIDAIMSMPQLAYTANWWCAQSVFVPRAVELTKVTGVFWGQCLERGISDIIKADPAPEWIVTMDYDSIFSGQQFDELCRIMAENPDIDALAPWEMKRESIDPIIYVTDKNGAPQRALPVEHFNGETYQVTSAHFGLTILRVESLRKMQHPWFHSTPNDDGEWTEGRVDDDIAFWRQWKEVGNTVHVACHVPIGHLQQVAVWPSEYMSPVYQFVTDFQKNGPPAEARK